MVELNHGQLISELNHKDDFVLGSGKDWKSWPYHEGSLLKLE